MPTTTDTVSVREGLARLLVWLTGHPEIVLSCVDYVDHDSAEVCLGSTNRTAGVAAAADVADALVNPTIEVKDPKGVCEVIVFGTITSRDAAALEVRCDLTVYGEALTQLLSSLGVPPDPTERCWPVTPGHLRDLAAGADTAVSA